MKIVLISDTHWGVRNDSPAFLNMTKKFMDNVFFPEIDKHNITTMIHLGDLVDRRKYINIQTAKRLREDFIQPIKDRKIEYHQILGNHDVYYKNTNEVNAVREIYGFDFSLYENTKEVVFDNLKILFVPWINITNREESLERIKKSNAKICMGHLEIQGFEMFKGTVSSHGEDRILFDSFHSVFSGHFHHISNDGCINYLGSHGQFTWSDYGDDRGFHIFDTKTLELTFIKNPYNMFSKIIYDDSSLNSDEILELSEYLNCKDTYVKVIVKNKNNPYLFDRFCQNIEKIGVLDMQIIEEQFNINLEDDHDIINEAESTIDIFKKYIGQSPNNINKQKLENTIVDIYNKAMSVTC
jgi:hypothetical protein